MSSTACRQEPRWASTPPAPSPTCLTLCTISVIYFHTKEILVTVFFVGRCASRVQIIYEGIKSLTLQSTHHPGLPGLQVTEGAGCPTVSFTRPPPTESPGKGENIPVDVTIHSVTWSPSTTGRSGCISYPFPQKKKKSIFYLLLLSLIFWVLT